jgi:hypothetical protein
MVKIVFHANKPMWVGLVVGVAGILMLLLHLTVLSSMDWLFTGGFATAIVGALIYLMGRSIQIMKKRY